MPYIKISQLRPNMVTSSNTYDKWGRLTLKNNTKLDIKTIKRLKKQGFDGLYVKDPLLFEQVELDDLLSKSLTSASSVKESYAPKDNKVFMKHLKSLDTIAIKSIKEILNENISIFDITNLKQHNDYTYTHSVKVAILSVMIGIGYGLTEHYLKELYIAGILHDIGKLYIPNTILNKHGRLTTEEYEEIKTHPTKGYCLLLNNNKLNETIRRGIRDHHENYDGTGYPYNLWRHEISTYGSIIHVADVFDALSSERPYHRPHSSAYAYNYIHEQSGKMFAPEIVEIFKRRITPYPLGSFVTLTDGRLCIVSETNIVNPWKPKLKVLDTGDMIDMEVEKYVNIIREV